MKHLGLLFVCASLFGQSYEVASVKPASPTQDIIDFVVQPGGHLRVVNLTLKDILRQAYDLKHWQIAGGPPWLDADRFNIEAKAAGEPTRAQMMTMLQALLADRFQLQARRETREGSVYELIVAKNGPKLKPSTAKSSYLRLYRITPPELPEVNYSIGAQKVTMARLADYLTGQVEHPVIERTGLDGEFDFKIDYAVEGHADEGPSIFTAIQEQAGLKLQSAKGPVQMLVIEKAERPAAN